MQLKIPRHYFTCRSELSSKNLEIEQLRSSKAPAANKGKALKDSEKVDKTVCHLPPVNPNGGEVYLFVPRDIAGKGKPDVAISEVFILSCYS